MLLSIFFITKKVTIFSTSKHNWQLYFAAEWTYFPKWHLYNSDSFDSCTIIWYLYNNENNALNIRQLRKGRQREILLFWDWIWTLISKTTAFSLIYLRESLCHSSNAFFALGLESIIAFLWGEQSRMTEDKYGLWERDRHRETHRKIKRKRESVRKTLTAYPRWDLHQVSLSFCKHFIRHLVFYFSHVMLGTSTHGEI